MRPISQSPSPQKPPVRFGSASGGGLGGITGAADALFRSFQSSRGKEMIVEDVVGFGVLRTGIDLHRNKMYGDDSWNVPAAAERFGREISSILTDSILGGVVAYGMSHLWFDRKNQAFSKEFIQYPSLELFQDIVGSKAMKDAKNPTEAKAKFIEALMGRLENKSGNNVARRILGEAWDLPEPKQTRFERYTSWLRANPNSQTFNEKAKNFIRALDNKATDFDLKFNMQWTDTGATKPQTFAVNDLLDDVNRFSRSMNRAWEGKASKTNNWRELAEAGIKKTIAAKNWKIPVGLAAGMAATFTMPFVSNFMTKKVFGIDYFPGETSLRKNQPEPAKAQTEKKSFLEQYFPYITQATRNGNPLPLGFALAPLLAAVGCVDTYKPGLVNPIKGLREGTLKKLFDFTKAAPFTSQQQMAAMFALLITSRLLSSRSDNEYQERVLDSAFGWGAWIVGTPMLKWGLSKLSGQQELFKAGGGISGLKSRAAVEAFSESALKANVRIGIVSTLATMGILGLGAPLLGIKLTQWNEKRKQEKLSAPQTPAPNPFAPQGQFSSMQTGSANFSQPFRANPQPFPPALNGYPGLKR